MATEQEQDRTGKKEESGLVPTLPTIDPPSSPSISDPQRPTTPLLENLSPSSSPKPLPTPPSEPPKKSYLPAWLLASKELSASVRRNSLECNVRLASLKTTVETFNDLCESTRRADELAKRPKTPEPPKPPVFISDALGADVACVILQFCTLPEWLRYSMTCTKVLRFVTLERADLWTSYYERHFLDYWEDVDTIAWKAEFEEEMKQENAWEEEEEEEEKKPTSSMSLRSSQKNLPSLQDVHEVNCTKKRTKVLLHAKAVHQVRKAFGKLRKDRSRERHRDPSPYVYNKRKDKTVAFPMPLRMSLNERSQPKSTGLIMSQVNTSSADQRKIILKAMLKMGYLTANPRDRLTCNEFLDFGAVTMCTALLANESGAVKELAALCLGNLIITPPRELDADEETRLGTGQIFGYKSDFEIELRHVLRKEVIAVNGLAALMELLSSPQARVTLHGTASTHSYQQDRIASMRCQSLANKHASRSLINLLLPDLEICVGDKEFWYVEADEEQEEKVEERGEEEKGEEAEKVIRTVQVIRRNGVETIPVTDGRPKRNPRLLARLGPAFTSHSKEMNWTCYYFYSSGTLKDVYSMRFRVGLDGTMQGRGEDVMGSFDLDGQGDNIFGEVSFAFSKTYLNRGLTSRGGHVCHIGFWSGGQVLGNLSLGLWGVWETVSGQHHFELRKGGVFRMIPSYLIDNCSREVVAWDVRAA
ncbi:hypothetical protein TrST_g13627 [Triparma strigata]|uniref:Uncharacterized protein n=1 Tax=Triparma strigata TaxID=1606541 RepID=A0A9W7F0N1_9STRA|nr:hypothetical protein TrST_g13627 [Triparma strigata]